ncbi:hypothetical protein [Streptomyces sp. WMMC897]|uniref:hypothetical protein n=1 Tax=Streptomyces sp. WMMC897 TaxID=3014782 RepID=UPI0022B5E774|nr:hypothetical protein [Streptomyces sp. WMMC897]MCZ7413069.1 hypothetical protein [Streptomyces sp. WMMC897]MCZ7415459.1 hypothetical protein [Streptomyces sp. WMMC897]
MVVAVGEVRAAAAGGDRRAVLEAIRNRLAEELDDAEGAQAASVAKELRAVMAELNALPGGKEVSPLDELTARREARRADAAGG